MTAAFRAAGDSSARGVILAANGPVFSAGHDFARPGRRRRRVDPRAARCVHRAHGHDAVHPPARRGAVHGLATAAGCQLVATADLAVAAEDAGFATPGGKGGWFCHTPLVAVARNISPKRALELGLTGDTIDAAHRPDWGLVNHVVPADQLDDATVTCSAAPPGAAGPRRARQADVLRPDRPGPARRVRPRPRRDDAVEPVARRPRGHSPPSSRSACPLRSSCRPVRTGGGRAARRRAAARGRSRRTRRRGSRRTRAPAA